MVHSFSSRVTVASDVLVQRLRQDLSDFIEKLLAQSLIELKSPELELAGTAQ